MQELEQVVRKVMDILGQESGMPGMGQHGLDDHNHGAAGGEGSQSPPCPNGQQQFARHQMNKELPIPWNQWFLLGSCNSHDGHPLANTQLKVLSHRLWGLGPG